ncbi:MAG: DUF4329 domain-containing protein [Pseudomonadales bacterium]|nr:DUF4329 domain-containing protein [Pseudomonadales bacterium]
MGTMLLLITSAWLLPLSAEASINLEGKFESELAALRAAVDIYNPISIQENREFLGTIYRYEDGYSYTVAAGERYSSSFSIRITETQLSTIVGLWHTHGNSSPNHRYFSEDDTRTAEQLNLPFYLADYTGYLKVFTPGDRILPTFAARQLGLGLCKACAIGKHITDEMGRRIRVKTH